MQYTFEAVVVGFEERLEVIARSSGFERWIRHAKLTLVPTGAALIGQVKHVGRTPEVTHVDGDAAVEMHSTVECRLHDNDLVASTASSKYLVHAVLRCVG